mgnify:CR=1 FL=1
MFLRHFPGRDNFFVNLFVYRRNQVFQTYYDQAVKDYIFDAERFTSFEGNTGPYILYTMVRIKSILTKYAEQAGMPLESTNYAAVPCFKRLAVLSVYRSKTKEEKLLICRQKPTFLWKQILRVSVEDLKKNYGNLGVSFDLLLICRQKPTFLCCTEHLYKVQLLPLVCQIDIEVRLVVFLSLDNWKSWCFV